MEEDSHSLSSTVVDLVFVYLEVVAALGRDDAMINVVVDFVVGDSDVVRVIVGIKPVLVVVVHLIIRPHTTLQRPKIVRHDSAASEAYT